MQLLLIQKHRILLAEILQFPFVHKEKKKAESVQNIALPEYIYRYMSTSHKLPFPIPPLSQSGYKISFLW